MLGTTIKLNSMDYSVFFLKLLFCFYVTCKEPTSYKHHHALTTSMLKCKVTSDYPIIGLKKKKKKMEFIGIFFSTHFLQLAAPEDSRVDDLASTTTGMRQE